MPGTCYTIHQFDVKDRDAYKNMRLEALQLEPGVFGASYTREAAFDDEVWLTRLQNKDAGHFGLYADDTLIGITGIIKDGEHPGQAHMIQSYIQKAHRGQGLSKMLYETRIAWARQHGVHQLIVGHRRSNTISRAANQRFGFTYTHAEIRDWPDGSREENLYYVLELI